MALTDIVVDEREIRHRGKCFTVRGLNFEDVSKLMFAMPDKVNDLVERFGDIREDSEPEKLDQAVKNIGFTLVREMPDLTARIIAAAADEPDGFEAARKLPVTVQLEALMSVGELTFVDAQGAVDFLGNVASLIAGAVKTATAFQAGKSTGTPG